MPAVAKKPTATSRLMKDYARLQEDPVPYIVAEPNPRNVLEWHYVVSGPENSPYVGGSYHGHLIFSPDFPFKPPSVYMITPNGRFKTQKRLCLSISDFHPEAWNPAWSVSTILVGLLSFMLEDTVTMGSIESSLREKRMWAIDSALYNLKNDTFREIFPNLSKELFAKLNEAQRRRLKEDFVNRKVKMDVFPELEQLPMVTMAGHTEAVGAAANVDCDKNNNTEPARRAVVGEQLPAREDDNMRWSTNVLILVVVLGGLILNYLLKSNSFYH